VSVSSRSSRLAPPCSPADGLERTRWRRALRGTPRGTTTGAAGQTVVVILPDTGERYITAALFERQA
jgi:hypothetical protein